MRSNLEMVLPSPCGLRRHVSARNGVREIDAFAHSETRDQTAASFFFFRSSIYECETCTDLECSKTTVHIRTHQIREGKKKKVAAAAHVVMTSSQTVLVCVTGDHRLQCPSVKFTVYSLTCLVSLAG